jgi:hypothetical protein
VRAKVAMWLVLATLAGAFGTPRGSGGSLPGVAPVAAGCFDSLDSQGKNPPSWSEPFASSSSASGSVRRTPRQREEEPDPLIVQHP